MIKKCVGCDFRLPKNYDIKWFDRYYCKSCIDKELKRFGEIKNEPRK